MLDLNDQLQSALPAEFDVCDPASAFHYLLQLMAFITQHKQLVACHLLDLFSDRLWQLVDPAWVAAIGPLSTAELKAHSAGVPCPTWPDSLRALFTTAASLSLNRTPASLAQQPSVPSSKPQPCGTPASASTVDLDRPVSEAAIETLQRRLAVGVSQKKQYEVRLTAALVARVAQAAGARFVVEFGCGQGHLALSLALQYGLHVIAVDADLKLVVACQRRYQQLASSSAGAAAPSASAGQLFAVTSQLTCDHALQCLDTLILELPTEVQDLVRQGAVLVGLHACGDLTPTLLRVFSGWQHAVALVSFGCCSNLLSEAADGAAQPSMPNRHSAQSSAPAEAGCCGDALPARSRDVAVAGQESEGVRCDDQAAQQELQSNAQYCSDAKHIAAGQPCTHRAEHPQPASPSPPGYCSAAHLSGQPQQPSAQHAPADARLGCNPAVLRPHPGFPMSAQLQPMNVHLGRHARMLACQSADRMAAAGSPAALDATLTSHIHRAGLELVLRRWYADVNPRELSVKSARKRRTLSSSRGYLRPYAAGEQPTPGSQAEALSAQQGSVAGVGEASSPQGEAAGIQQAPADLGCPKQCACMCTGAGSGASALAEGSAAQERFAAYVQSALQGAGMALRCTSEQLHQVWQEAVLPRCAAFRTLWLLRQVLAPVLETLIVVDRLAYLLEGSVRHSTAAQHSAAQHSSSSSGPVAAAPSDPGCGQTAHAGTAVFVSAVFDPATSPRNIALIALRSAPALPDCPMALGSSIAN